MISTIKKCIPPNRSSVSTRGTASSLSSSKGFNFWTIWEMDVEFSSSFESSRRNEALVFFFIGEERGAVRRPDLEGVVLGLKRSTGFLFLPFDRSGSVFNSDSLSAAALSSRSLASFQEPIKEKKENLEKNIPCNYTFQIILKGLVVILTYCYYFKLTAYFPDSDRIYNPILLRFSMRSSQVTPITMLFLGWVPSMSSIINQPPLGYYCNLNVLFINDEFS